MLKFEEEKILTPTVTEQTLNNEERMLYMYVNKQVKILQRETVNCDSLLNNRAEYIKKANGVLFVISALYKNIKEKIIANLELQSIDAIDILHQVDATLTYCDGEIILRFNRLPYKRSYSISDNTHSFSNEFFDAVFRAFSIYKERNTTTIRRIRNDKALVTYVFHYISPSDLLDYDNYDLKPITDSIKSIFLEDDSPYYIDQYFTSQKDDKAFLEIRIKAQKEG